MNFRVTLSAGLAAASVLASVACAEVSFITKPNADWPFGEYRTCLGYSGVYNFAKQFVKDDQSRMAKAGQGEDKQYLVTNWSDAILNEQIIAAHELTVEQCRLRKAGESFSTECPLGNLSRDEAVKKVGADQDEFWNQPSNNLAALKKEQKTRLRALGPVIEEACGP